MIAYKCLRCSTIHGWTDHPNVSKVERHIRYPGEDVWYCPGCCREHRTTDGTMLGQLHKLWEVVDPDEEYTFVDIHGLVVTMPKWHDEGDMEEA